MTTWQEVRKNIEDSLPGRADDARRLFLLIDSAAMDDPPVAAHLTAQTSPGSTPIVLDILVLSRHRLYDFFLDKEGTVVSMTMGLDKVSQVRIEGAKGQLVVRFSSGDFSGIAVADLPEREASLLAFARAVIQAAWPA